LRRWPGAKDQPQPAVRIHERFVQEGKEGKSVYTEQSTPAIGEGGVPGKKKAPTLKAGWGGKIKESQTTDVRGK